jgi:hypothetical protein
MQVVTHHLSLRLRADALWLPGSSASAENYLLFEQNERSLADTNNFPERSSQASGERGIVNVNLVSSLVELTVNLPS